MKTFVSASAIALAFAAGTPEAFAADLPARPWAVAPAPPLTNWTGFYVSGGFGYGMWTADTTTLIPTTGVCDLCVPQRQGGRGWLGTVGVGFDYQANLGLPWVFPTVFGAFADFDFASLKGTIQDQGPFFAGETKLNRAWSAGARAGWLATPSTMTYVNGGFTEAHFTSAHMGFTFPTSRILTFSTPAFSKGGWFIGGGVETTFPNLLPGLFWRTEYRYADYGTRTLTDTSSSGVVEDNITFHPIVQTIRSELVYKFNWAATAGAYAADVSARPYVSAPTARPVANWTGLYVNGGFGYGMWTADTTTVSPTTGVCSLCVPQRQGGRGWLGTIGGGFDYQAQMGLPWIFPTVFGAFADVDFASLKGTIQDQTPIFAGETKLDRAWSVGGRAGWVVTPGTMTYANGGYTQAHFTSAQMVELLPGSGATAFSTPAFSKGGWFIGGGVETTFPNLLPGLFWRTEYRYADYGTRTLTDTAPGGALIPVQGVGLFPNPQNSITFHPIVQTIRTELVYKFDWLR